MTWIILLAIVMFVIVPVVDYWPASKVWVLVYWRRFWVWLDDTTAGRF